jgi:hypothetical protein
MNDQARCHRPAALILDNDGWASDRKRLQCAMAGMDEQGYAFFQIVAAPKRTEKH